MSDILFDSPEEGHEGDEQRLAGSRGEQGVTADEVVHHSTQVLLQLLPPLLHKLGVLDNTTLRQIISLYHNSHMFQKGSYCTLLSFKFAKPQSVFKKSFTVRLSGCQFENNSSHYIRHNYRRACF